MNPLLLHLIIYVACFFFVWYGAGIILKSVHRLADKLHLPAFTLSFFLLGILTSLPEIAIASSSVINDMPSIFVGNLLGGVIIMFLGVIPLMGVLGGGVNIPKQLDQKHLLATLIVVLAPAFLILDKELSLWEAWLLIFLYGLLFLFFSFKQTLAEKIHTKIKKKREFRLHDFFKIIVGVVLLVFASNQIIKSTLFFADLWSISPFFVSLVVVSVGTNIPEISLVFRSIMHRKKDIALADYLGSASANTLLFGVFTLIYGKPISLPNPSMQRFIFLTVGLVLFFFFSKSKNRLSWKECFVLLCGYCMFIWLELRVVT